MGSWDPRVAYGTRVKIWVGDKPDSFVTGVIGAKPAHLTEPPEGEKAVPFKDTTIDFGAEDQKGAEEMVVRVGCVATPDSSLIHLGFRDGVRV